MAFYPMLFALAITLVVICLVLFFFKEPSRIQQRLQAPLKWEPVLVQSDDSTRILPTDLVKKVEEKLGLGRNSVKAQEMKRTLAKAGFSGESASSIYMGIKVGLALGLPILSLPLLLRLQLNTIYLIIAFYLLVLLGYLFPSLALGHLISGRKAKIRESLPDALDLLVVCVEAGLGLHEAIKVVGNELEQQGQIIGRELAMVSAEMASGRSLGEALRAFADRTAVQELKPLASTMIQSEQMGSQIGPTLKASSDAMRAGRRLRAEEDAQKATIKILFPLVLFVLPAMLIVIVGPAVIQIIGTLNH